MSRYAPFRQKNARLRSVSYTHLKTIYLTFQEYFERLGADPKRWGKPFAALLGAYRAQLELGIAAIGGKDSMSGSFNELDVPPTLTSFAVAIVEADKVVSQELKKAGTKLVLLPLHRDNDDMPDFDRLKPMYDKVHSLIADNKVLSSCTVKSHGLAEVLAKMAFGNMIGIDIDEMCIRDRYETRHTGADNSKMHEA